MSSNQRRQPEGTPAGGEFASTTHAEPDEVLLAVDVDEAAVCSDHGISLVDGCYECDPDDFDTAGARLSDEDVDARDVRRRLVAMKTSGLLDSLTDSSDAERLVELDRRHPNGSRDLAVRAMSLYVRDLDTVASDRSVDHDARLEDLREMQARIDSEMAEACQAKIASETLARFPTAATIAVTNGSLRDDVMAPKFVFDHEGNVIADVDAVEKWRRSVAAEVEDLGRTDAVGSMFERGSLVVEDDPANTGARVAERSVALGSGVGRIGNYRLLPVQR